MPLADRKPCRRFRPTGASKSVIQTVAMNEPVEGLEEVLPGFISNEDGDETAMRIRRPSAPRETVTSVNAAAARRVAVQRGQAPTVVPNATQVSATSPSPTTTYVLYPTADGASSRCPREIPQIVASQPVVSAPTVTAPAPAAPTVKAPQATVRQQPYNPYPTANAIETTVPSEQDRIENSRFPLLSHVLLGDSAPAERLPPASNGRPEFGSAADVRRAGIRNVVGKSELLRGRRAFAVRSAAIPAGLTSASSPLSSHRF